MDLITAGTPALQHHDRQLGAAWVCCGTSRWPLIYVRPQRHTFAFLEEQEIFTLSFFSPRWKKQLAYCGAVSGRDEDKFAACGFHVAGEGQAAYPQEADLVLVCKNATGMTWTRPTWTRKP